MTHDGNVLWAWQSQDPDGSGRWSIIAMFLGTAEQAASRDPQPGGEFLALIHRDRSIVVAWKEYAQAHKRRWHQPIRLARFHVAETEEAM